MSDPLFPTQEEHELIRKSVLLPLVLKILEKNRKALEAEMMSIKRLYLVATDILIHRIKADVAVIKKELWAQKIKVFDEQRPGIPIGYAYVCRGHVDQVVLSREEVIAEINTRLGFFVQQLISELNQK